MITRQVIRDFIRLYHCENELISLVFSHQRCYGCIDSFQPKRPKLIFSEDVFDSYYFLWKSAESYLTI